MTVGTGVLRLPLGHSLDAMVLDCEGQRYDVPLNPRVAFSGKLQPRFVNNALTGEDVYTFNFSALSTPGVYRVFVPDVGVSDAFVIADDVLDYVAYTTGRGLFYQV